MKYTYYQGLIKERISKLAMLTIALLFALTAAMGAIQSSTAASSTNIDYTEIAFTETELGNWSTDRTEPSGGYFSLNNFQGRNDVLELNIDTGNQSTLGQFYYTEGLKRYASNADAVRIDMFVDQDWAEKSVRAGLWGVGNNDDGDITSYPIVEYTTEGQGGFTGWRIWDGVLGGWNNIEEISEGYGEWSTLEIILDESAGEFSILLNGEEIGVSDAGSSTNIADVIVNTFNYGAGSDSYSVRFNNFAYGMIQQPEAPTNLTVVDSSGSTITNGAWTNSYSITASWDKVNGASSYEYSYWNNIESSPYFSEANRWIVDNGAGLSRSGVFNQGEGMHYIAVRAVSSSGLESEWSDTFTVGYDKTTPTASNAMLNDVAVDDAHIRSENCEDIRQAYTVSGEFDFSVMIEDDLSGVNNAWYRVRAMTAGGCTLTNVFSSGRVNLQYDETLNKWVTPEAFDVSELADGLYTIMLASRDKAGNQITNYIDLQVDNSPKNMEECKNGGWMGYYRNQGICVSEFATVNARGNALGNRR
jgi:hypothetical protein